MRNLVAALLLAGAPLAALPFALAAATGAYAATVTELGDLAPLAAIAADTMALTRTGDLAAAQTRITDFESAWDRAAGAMQPLSPARWGAVDVAADVAIESLRAPNPSQPNAEAALAGLIAELDNPGAGLPAATAGAPVAAAAVAVAFAVTNADGSPLPCEVALKSVREAAASKTPSDQPAFDTAMSKGLERCNADDDKRADGFFADAFGLLR